MPPTAVAMPRLSDSMEEGTIVRWLKQDGDQVAAGEELVEIETDKATVGYEAELSGPLTVLVQPGETVAVGAIIAEIGVRPDADADAGANADAAPTVRATTPRLRVSPVARRLARELRVDLSQLTPTGPAGRIVKRDVLAVAEASPTASLVVVDMPVDHHATDARGHGAPREPLTPTQATIARRMVQAAAIPAFTVTAEAEMDAVLSLRDQLAGLSDGRPPSINDFVVKATALALRRHPKVNASFHDDGFELHEAVNIGVAVAIPNALLVPVLAGADGKSLARIASDTRWLAQRAREGRLTPVELGGATFTVSNLGMFGITRFNAILNPPQAAILAVGSLAEHVRLHDGVPAVSRRLSLTLTCDHRILYGADAAAFLDDVRTNLEQPLRLAL